MLNDQEAITSISNITQHDHDNHHQNVVESPITRDIHALTPPRVPWGPRHESHETSNHNVSTLSIGSSENFSTMSREFSALVMEGSTFGTIGTEQESNISNLERIREEDLYEETNPLAIVPDNNLLDPLQPQSRMNIGGGNYDNERSLVLNTRNDHTCNIDGEVSMQHVKKEEVESRINAWQNAKIAKVNNRFKREDSIINGWEVEQAQKASSWMKKVERKLEEKRAKAIEKMQNDLAKAHEKAEERRATSEAKRGTKVARILEIANVMRAIGQPPVKRSFFK